MIVYGTHINLTIWKPIIWGENQNFPTVHSQIIKEFVRTLLANVCEVAPYSESSQKDYMS